MERTIYSFLLLLFCIFFAPAALFAQIKVTQDPPPALPKASPNAPPGLSPVEFNNKLAAINDSLQIKGNQWDMQFEQAGKTKDYTKLAGVRQSLEHFVDQKLTEVKSMKDVKDSKAWREAILKLLMLEKGMIAKAYKPFEELGKNPAEAQRSAAMDNLNFYSSEQRLAMQQVTDAQEAYARSNGLTAQAK